MIVFFDGVCNLCNGFIQFLIARDPDGVFQYAPLQSQAARTHLPALAPGASWPDSIIVVDDGRAFVKSDAVLRIARRLPWPWRAARAGAILPRAARDVMYDAIARRRYRWFGRRDVCMVPTPDLRRRFLE